MIRLIFAAIVLLALAWFLAKDNGPDTKIAAEQRDDLEQAKENAAFAEKAEQKAADQTDAIRDIARGKDAGGAGEPQDAGAGESSP